LLLSSVPPAGCCGISSAVLRASRRRLERLC
jgi:hypothetical protein